MFGLRSKTPQHLANARSALRWFDSLPANNPLAVQRAVLAELHKLEERTARRTPAQLEAVFALDGRMNGIVDSLAAQYAEHAGRSPKIEHQLWQALFDLAQEFQTCYATFARHIPDVRPRKRWSLHLAELVARQIVQLRRDAKYRLYRSEPWVPVKWAELHATFLRARRHQLDRRLLLQDPSGGATTIEREYLIVLMLALADPGCLAPAQVEWVASQIDVWCRPLRLTPEPTSSPTFYVDLAGSTGLRRGSPGPLEGRVLFVDTTALHASIVQRGAGLEHELADDPLAEDAPRKRELRALLIKLASRVDPEFTPLARRGERRPASGSVDAITGFSGISGFLHDDELSPAAEFSAGRSFGNTQDLAVFGRTRIEPDHQSDRAYRRIAAYVAPGGPWEMKDISASGFRLHAPMSVATEVTLSMLVAIHRREPDSWVLGIVRRMRRLSANNAEIGLQLIAKSLVSADLIPQQEADHAHYSASGEATGLAARRIRGLYVSFHRHTNQPSVQSLILPPGEYRSTKRYALRISGATHAIRFGRILEQYPDWIWTVIESVEPDMAASAPKSAR